MGKRTSDPLGSLKKYHEANRACWDDWAEWWSEKTEKRGIWKKCYRDPSLALSAGELTFLGDLTDKSVCVLGSGDNEVAFAMAGMGARVTSVDISEKQLTAAEKRAESLGLNITFLRADITDLAEIDDKSFDIVYTGGHVSVWIADINRYYGEAVRILKPEGLFMVNDYHPVRRMWHDSEGPEPRHRYFNRGPYPYTSNEGIDQVEFHWTTADHIQAAIDAGCILVKVDEFGESTEPEDYEKSVPRGLPLYLFMVGRKKRTVP